MKHGGDAKDAGASSSWWLLIDHLFRGGVRVSHNGILVDETSTVGQNLSVTNGDAEFQAFGDAAGAFQEVFGGSGRANGTRGMFEQFEPTIKVSRIDRQMRMFAHGVAMKPARHQCDGRPEIAHGSQMGFPVGDVRGEDRGEQRVISDAGVKTMHKALDHRLVNAGMINNLISDFGAALF